MDELERRLANALHSEAQAVEPHNTNWKGRPPASARRGWPTWAAIAAVVAALVVGMTLAITRSAGTPDTALPPSDTVGSVPATTDSAGSRSCDGGWAANGTSIIAAGNNSVVTGTTAVLRFAGGNPGPATLCALVTGSDHITLASGSATLDGSKLGYLTMISGEGAYFVGAFGGATTAVTFAAGELASSPGESGPVTITASTRGVIDLGDGWHGYAVLAPRTASPVIIATATSAGGAVLGRQQFRLINRTSSPTPLPSSSINSSTQPDVSSGNSPVSKTDTNGGDAPTSPQCGGRLPAPLPGLTATIIPAPNGQWQFRLTNATTLRLTVDTVRGSAQVMADDHGVVQSVGRDESYVLRTVVLNAAESKAVEVVGVDTALCTGGRVPTGDHTMHLVLTGQLGSRSVVFTAATYVLHFSQSAPPTLIT
ncbi:hypothetical protein ABIB25_003063 [Nakamurella sp. UYEF19]|uniref:hypothetical protein n=1 Tax=Nakamurella sp. UYEF19 TaxID=1756392 RepID=UPI003395E429